MTPYFPPCKPTVPVPDTTNFDPYGQAFLDGLRDHGYVPGSNITVDRRCVKSDEEARKTLSEFVARSVDVIVLTSSGYALAARQASRTIPIVCAACSDPVEHGVVTSLARPGQNVTGLGSLAAELIAKRIELLKEAVPHLARLAVFVNPGSPATRSTLSTATETGRALGIQVQRVEFSSVSDFEKAFRSAAIMRADAALIQDDPVSSSPPALTQIGSLAVTHRLPAATGFPRGVNYGIFLAYGPDRVAMSRRAATFVHKILKGAKPSDLPFEQPTKIDLEVNLKTARTLGIKIPSALLLRADRIVE